MVKPLSCRRWSAIAAVVSVMGCGGGKSRNSESTAAATATDTAAQTAPVAAPTGKEDCPATGLWAECSAFKALDRAGLAPRRDSTGGPVRLAPLTRPGTRLLVGASQIDIFVYPTEADRARDEARLDKHQFIEATDEPTLRGEPTLIRNANLLAILRSRDDHQRERVSDALSAGPPQPSHATPIPGSTAR